MATPDFATLTQTLLDNADFDGNATKAAAFVTAARQWLILAPTDVEHGGDGAEKVSLNPDQVANLLKRAENEASQISAGVTHFDLDDFRS